FGTRPLLTQESPIPDVWKRKLLTLKEGDIFLNHFSPTGFYSSAVNNQFIQELRQRSERQVVYTPEPLDSMTEALPFGNRGRKVYVHSDDKEKAEAWIAKGFDTLLKTPDSTIIFVTEEKAEEIHKDQIDCMGCLSMCQFSNWKDHDDYTTGRKADPRS